MLDKAGKVPACRRDLNPDLCDSTIASTPKMVSRAQSLPHHRPCSDRSLQRQAVCYHLLPIPCSQEAWQTGGSNLASGASDKPKATKVLNPPPHLQFQR